MEMEPDSVLNLFDSLWFYNKREPNTIPVPTTQPKTHKRSKSDQFLTTPNSPNSVLSTPHLETIHSGKKLSIQIPPKTQQFNYKPNKGLAKKKRLSKSLSELEFEELSGFLDLGFVFNEEDKDSDLAGILPGLQRLGRESNGPRDNNKPYLSEAWEVLMKKEEEEEEEEESLLMKWKLPDLGNENDMKDSLKWWAHSVASSAAAAATAR